MIPMVDAAIIDSIPFDYRLRFDSPAVFPSIVTLLPAISLAMFFLALAEHGHHLNRRQVKLQYNTGKSRF